MMDNWSLENSFVYLQDNTISTRTHHGNPNESRLSSWINFLNALVLWDEIWFYSSYYSYGWKNVRGKLREQNLPLEELDKIIHPIDEMFVDTKSIEELNHYLESMFHGAVERGAIYYRELSNLLGLNVLLHPARSTPEAESAYEEYFAAFANRKKFQKNFSRLDILDRVDRELLDYYDNIKRELGRDFFQIQNPVFYDYIGRNARTPREAIDVAISLREDSDIIRFKGQIDEVEGKINSGNTQALLALLKQVADAAQEITNQYNRETHLCDVKISFKPDISKTIPIKFNASKERKVHLAFFSKLLEFGVYERMNHFKERSCL